MKFVDQNHEEDLIHNLLCLAKIFVVNFILFVFMF
jgi:hypothetical protein